MVEKTFTLPGDISADVARLIVEWSNPLMFSLAEKLEGIGVPKQFAIQIEVGAHMTCAARVGLVGASLVEGRHPNRDRWVEAVTEDFDQAIDWFVEKHPERAAELGLKARNRAIDARFVL